MSLWTAGSSGWSRDVAGTDGPPIGSANVRIVLSTDGGATFPHILAEEIPNDGSQIVEVPGVPTLSAWVAVQAVDNIFFALSPTSFKIVTCPHRAGDMHQHFDDDCDGLTDEPCRMPSLLRLAPGPDALPELQRAAAILMACRRVRPFRIPAGATRFDHLLASGSSPAGH
jgi:hypothetical protein